MALKFRGLVRSAVAKLKFSRTNPNPMKQFKALDLGNKPESAILFANTVKKRYSELLATVSPRRSNNAEIEQCRDALNATHLNLSMLLKTEEFRRRNTRDPTQADILKLSEKARAEQVAAARKFTSAGEATMDQFYLDEIPVRIHNLVNEIQSQRSKGQSKRSKGEF